MPVLNYHFDEIPEDAVNIMRPFRWSNRFIIGKHGTRDQVIDAFERDLANRVQRGEVAIEDLAALDGAYLVCCCAPKRCHGDVLLEAAAWASQQLANRGNRP